MACDDFRNEQGLWAKGNGKSSTKSYRTWYDMTYRCKPLSLDYLARHPTYADCSVSERFLDFQNFANWCMCQVGYAEHRYDLDKDLLLWGNREYSDTSCVFIPRDLNNFYKSSKSPKDRGVTRISGNFRVGLRVSGKKMWLGTYSTSEEASYIYKVAKEAEAYRWYERLRDGEFVVDPRVIERMRTWTFEEGN